MANTNLTPVAYNEARLAKQAAESAGAAIAAYSPIKSIQQVIGTSANWGTDTDGGIAIRSLDIAINPVNTAKAIAMPLRTNFITSSSVPQSLAYRILNTGTVRCLSIGPYNSNPGAYAFVVVEYK